MNIILIGTAYPLRGGIAHYFALLFKHLSKRHQVSVVTFSRQYPGFLFPGKSQEESPGGPEGEIPSEQLMDSINPFSWISTARSIIKKQPDLLIFKYWIPFFAPCFGVIAMLVKRRTNAKVLFICDNVVPHERRPGDKVLTRFAFRYADFFIVQSKPVERDLINFKPGARYEFVHHPIYEIFGGRVDKQQAQKQLSVESERVLLFFGYVRKYKGLDTLLDAMPMVLKTLDVKLLIVGEFYDSEEHYRERIRKEGLASNVKVVSEYVPNDQVGKYFSASDVVVLPYHSATQSGIVQIAYQFDKPVIATDVGGLSEVVIDGTTGFIVKPDEPEELARAIVRFYGEKREAPFVSNVREEKKKYSWDSLIGAIERLMATPGNAR